MIEKKKKIRLTMEGRYNSTQELTDEQLKYLKREWATLERLKRRLDLINVEQNFAEILGRKQASKEAMERSFTVVNASQHKFDKMISDKEHAEEGIHNNTRELHELMGKINEAEAAYNAQDPKEREKSFSIAY